MLAHRRAEISRFPASGIDNFLVPSRLFHQRIISIENHLDSKRSDFFGRNLLREFSVLRAACCLRTSNNVHVTAVCRDTSPYLHHKARRSPERVGHLPLARNFLLAFLRTLHVRCETSSSGVILLASEARVLSNQRV